MSEFKVLAPDKDPALTGFPVEKSKHKTPEAAIEAAKKVAQDTKRLNSVVLVEETGTNNTWSVHFHPERPSETGAVDELGIPQFKFDPEFRIVFDGQEVETSYDKPDEPVVGKNMVGEKSAFDITADGEEVDRDDLV